MEIQRLRGFPVRTKPDDGFSKTLAPTLLSSPILLSCRSSQSDEAMMMGSGPPALSRAPRRHVRPPLGGCTAIKRPHGSVSPRALTDKVASARLLWVPEHTSSSGGRTRSIPVYTPRCGGLGFYFHRGADALSSGDTGSEHIDDDSILPARRWWFHRGMNRGKVRETLTHSIPSFFLHLP
jgi:hypothetical protein